MNAILEFKNISYFYQESGRQVHILNKANYSFERGKFYAIIGPSGSGKTTSLSLAGGLDAQKEGQILYDGINLKKIGLSNYRRSNVAIVFQAYNLITYMSALQNVVMAMDITGTKETNKKDRALRLLEAVGLSRDEATRNVLKLSGGQQQRVAIARALARDVDLIMADEPTGNLDQETASGIIQTFKNLAHNENKCIIAVTHSHELANEADHVIHLKDGLLIDNPKEKSELFQIVK